MFIRNYDFTENGEGIFLSSHDLFSEEQGAGFLALSQNPTERLPDRFTGTGGFNPGGSGLPVAGHKAHLEHALEAHPVEHIFQTSPALTDTADGVEAPFSGYPLRFRAQVPHPGIYLVNVTIRGGETGLTGLCLYTGRRNLVQRDIAIAPGDVFSCCFYCHVCEYIPVVGQPAVLDRSIYVSVLGDRARLSAVAISEASAPTLFLAGDSLVADYDGLYPYNPLLNGGSWGQNLLQYFPRLAVNNQAHGGMTTNCFRSDGHLDIVLANIRAGDIFMLEFGHNDQKRRYLKAFDQYASNLRWYISQIRQRGAYPVIVTPMSRIPSEDENGYYDLLEDFAESCLRVGRECKVPVIDLHRHSFGWLCDLGVGGSKDYFNDTTHTNDYGALLMADYIAKEIGRQQIAPLADYLEAVETEPWRPDPSLRPEGTLAGAEKEERPILPVDLPELPYQDCQGIAGEGTLKTAMAMGLLDPSLKFFHPFDEMPRGQFLYVLSKAVKNFSASSYQGRYCDIYRYEFDAKLVLAALEAGLIDEGTTPDGRFRPDDPITQGELTSICVRASLNHGERELDMAQCEQIASRDGLRWEGYQRGRFGSRLQCVEALVWLVRRCEGSMKAPCEG